MANQLAKDYNLKIIVYTWGVHDKVDWGTWDERIIIRIVPYSRYFQKVIAKIFYYLWIKIDKPNKIICNFLWHGETVIFNRKKDVIIFHNPVSQIPLRYKFAQKYIDYNTSIIFDSNHSLNEFMVMDAKYANCKMIHTGVDTEYFKPSEKDENNKLNLLCISEFEERKGIQYLIKAMPDLIMLFPSIILRIIGSGEQNNNYEQLIDQLGIKDYVDIQSPVNDTKPYLLMADIYFLLSDGEGFPLGLLEAMSCGLPVITSDYPPFNEIDDKVIQKVNRYDINDIVIAIKNLDEVNNYKTFSNRSRTYVKSYHSWKMIAEKYYPIVINSG